MELDRDLKRLLFALADAEGWTSAAELGEQLGWPRKKVQQGVVQLRSALAGECDVESRNRLGYRIVALGEGLRADILRDELFDETFFNLDERRSMLALDLLMRDDYASMEALGERHYLSKTTVFEEVRQLRRWFGRMGNLELEVSGTRGVRVTGAESAKRLACATFGQIHVFRLMGLGYRELRELEEVEELAAGLLRKELLQRGCLVSGEEFAFVVRYLGVTSLRDGRGFVLEDAPILSELTRWRFIDELAERGALTLTDTERSTVSTLLAQADIVCGDRGFTDSGELWLTRLERAVIEAYQLETDHLFLDRATAATNIASALARRAQRRQRAQYYDQGAIRHAPLCLHVARRAFIEACNVDVGRYEAINMGIFLGGEAMRFRRRSSISALLVGNQDFEILGQVRARTLERLPLSPASFALLPTYGYEGQQADLMLTTSAAFALEHPEFLVVPPVATGSDRSRLWRVVDGWLARWRTDLTHRIWDQAHQRAVTGADSLQELAEADFLSEATAVYQGRGRLLVLSTSDAEPTGLTCIRLQSPLAYEYHQVREVVLLNHRPSEPDAIEWFDAALRGLA